MAGQMTIVLRSDPGPFQEGTDAAIKAIRDWETQTGVSADNASEKLEDAIRAVVDLGKQTDRSGEDIERALRGLGLEAEDAEDAVAAIEAETRSLGRQGSVDIKESEEALDDLGRAADDAGDKTGSIKDKASDVGDGLRDLGDVVNDVLEGDFGSAAAGAIEALGGIAGSLTGGAIGGAITSAVSGIVGGWVESWDEAAKESEERIGTWADNFIENQARVLSEAQILENVQKILRDDTEAQARAQEISTATGLTYAESLRALAGDTEYLADAQARLDEQVTASKDRVAEIRDEYGRVPPNVLEARDALIALRDGISGQVAEMEAGVSNFEAYAAAAELGKEKTDALTESIQNVPSEVNTTVRVRWDQSAFDSNMAALQRRAAQGVTVNIRPGAGRLWE